MSKYFTDKEYKLIEAFSVAIYEYTESIDQTEQMNENPLISELREFCEPLIYDCFKMQHSEELSKALAKINMRNIVPFK